MNLPFLDLKRQTDALRAEIDAAVARVLERSRYVLDEELETFERAWADFCGAKHAIGVGNGTQALEIALRAAGIGEGHEVITSPLTAAFTALAIVAVGARPVFADIDPDTLLLSPEAAEKKINRRTRAIIPVHLYGRAADMKAFRQLARKHGLELIQDACQAHGAMYDGKPLASWSRWVAFSFYPTKNLGALGDGGGLVTNDAAAAAAARLLRNGGIRANAVSERPAINSRLDEIQAAILGAKLTHLRDWTTRRRKLAETYAARVSPPVGGLGPAGEHVFHLYVVRTPRRAAVRERLARAGIGTGIHYPQPLHLHPAFRGIVAARRGSLPVAERACREILSLPLHPELQESEIEAVCDAFYEATSPR